LLDVTRVTTMMDDDVRARRRAALAEALDTDTFQSLSSAIAVDVGAASAVGRLQPWNTDHYLALRVGRTQDTMVSSLAASDLPGRFEEFAYALLVADGIGETGARASRVALSTLAHLAVKYGRWNVRIEPDTIADIYEQGEFLYRRLHAAIVHASRSALELIDMATNLTALYVAEADLFYAHVGRSSAYLFRDGRLMSLTPPPSGAEAQSALDGRHRPGDIEVEHCRLESGDRLLVCSNGVTDVLSASQIADALAPRRRAQDDCQRLIDLAVAAGNLDDATALVADYTVRDGQVPPTTE
jgi:protein phosphatase